MLLLWSSWCSCWVLYHCRSRLLRLGTLNTDTQAKYVSVQSLTLLIRARAIAPKAWGTKLLVTGAAECSRCLKVLSVKDDGDDSSLLLLKLYRVAGFGAGHI